MSRLYSKTLFFLLMLATFGCKTYIPQINSEILANAQNGNAVDQFELGKIYFEAGWKQPLLTKSSARSNNLDEAEKWLVKSADQGHIAAKFYVSYLFQNKSNDECSLNCLKKAALEGIAEAQYRLGVTYLTDDSNTPKDLAVAYKWMILSAKDDYERYNHAWKLINHYDISHLEISKGQKMAKEHVEEFGISKSIYPEK